MFDNKGQKFFPIVMNRHTYTETDYNIILVPKQLIFSLEKPMKLVKVCKKPHHQISMSMWIFDFDQNLEGLKAIYDSYE